MSSALEKGLGVISFLAERPEGASVSEIAKALDLPPSGVHRLLKELEALGYTRQSREHGDYMLTLKLATNGLAFLARTGIPDLSQPILDRLAQSTKELIRMALFDGEELVWVGVSQGATAGLRYDPDAEHGQIVHLASASGGQAWLSGLSDDDAVASVMRQGLEKPGGAGVSAPKGVAELLQIVQTARAQGYAQNTSSFMLGMAAIAVLIRHPDTDEPIGTVSIAGPSARATPELLHSFLPELRQAATDLAEASLAGRSFTRWYDETMGRRQTQSRAGEGRDRS
ncbi:IclR family transcriptional regulator [Salipiger abyssi]|uniref:IclR family transcriptional regulator n=1 Tax=Salipiger abyssi TaxID=1250539 RepID=UPI001A8EC5D2|nr:IclR family transcriptional regulator [Salipiger abyssi]MBN9888569.1 IclR family transcriptional regulator [Salipiger abyssi]